MEINNKKEQERSELHRVIWGIANDLRGSVDGWDFKQYVLGMLMISFYLSLLFTATTHRYTRGQSFHFPLVIPRFQFESI